MRIQLSALATLGRGTEASAQINRPAPMSISNALGLILRRITVCACLLTTPCFGQADDPSVHYSTYHFALTKGHHLPVCEAFLKRLNAAQSPKTPYCDIPEDDSVPGFTKLNRVSLSADEVTRLWSHIFWFTKAQDESITRKDEPSVNVASLLGTDLLAWRYDPPVSLNNDGQPDNVVMWQGYGADDTVAACGGD